MESCLFTWHSKFGMNCFNSSQTTKTSPRQLETGSSSALVTTRAWKCVYGVHFDYVWCSCRFTHKRFVTFWIRMECLQTRRLSFTLETTKAERVTGSSHMRCSQQNNCTDTINNSAELKRGQLHETLERNFTFVDIRTAKVSNDLQKLLVHHQFMDSDVPSPEDKYRMSTLYRWREQASVHFWLQPTRFTLVY